MATLAADVLAWPPTRELAADLAVAGRAVTLAMLAVRLTAPGVPDLYQGTEALRYVLVDPDNRTEPDWDALDTLVDRAASLDGPASWAEPGAPAARAVLINRVLAARRALDLAGYAPVPAPPGLVAFARLDSAGAPVLVTCVSRASRRASEQEAAVSPASEPRAAVSRASPVVSGTVELPGGAWRSLLDDDVPVLDGALDAAGALARFPAVVLVRVD